MSMNVGFVEIPDFAAQSGEPMTMNERKVWLDREIERMREKGATWFRATLNPDVQPNIVLLEGWLVRPKVEPEPEFFLTHVAK